MLHRRAHATQAVAFRRAFADASPLLSIAAAMLDCQHDCPALLAAAGDAVASQDGAAVPEEVVGLLLAVGFFGAPAPEFVALALEALSDAAEDVAEELEPQQLGRLWRALVLLRQDGVAPPPPLAALLHYAVARQLQDAGDEGGGDGELGAADARDLLLLGSSRGALACLQQPEVLAGAPQGLREQWEQAGMLAAVDVLRALQEQQGWTLQARVPVAAQPPEVAEELRLPPAVVDVAARLPGGRTVAVVVRRPGAAPARGPAAAPALPLSIGTHRSIAAAPATAPAAGAVRQLLLRRVAGGRRQPAAGRRRGRRGRAAEPGLRGAVAARGRVDGARRRRRAAAALPAGARRRRAGGGAVVTTASDCEGSRVTRARTLCKLCCAAERPTLHAL